MPSMETSTSFHCLLPKPSSVFHRFPPYSITIFPCASTLHSSFIAHNPATIPSLVIHSSSSSPPLLSFGVKLFLTYRLFALFLDADLSSLDSVDSLTDLFTAFRF